MKCPDVLSGNTQIVTDPFESDGLPGERGVMENETNLQTEESFPQDEQNVIAPDWTESEWFEVWLKLARREYESTDD
jgi:hypothetical protein